MSDGEAWHELSDLYLKVGEYSKAAFCVEELLLSNPHDAIYFTRYAEIRYTQVCRYATRRCVDTLHAGV